MKYEDCYKKGLLKKVAVDKGIIDNLLEMAGSDLEEAERSYGSGSHVWASVQVYAAMLNLARAVLYSDGIKEKSHYCTVEYIREHYSSHFGDLVNKFDVLRRERHLTLYDSREHMTAEKAAERLEWGKQFKTKTDGLLKNRL